MKATQYIGYLPVKSSDFIRKMLKKTDNLLNIIISANGTSFQSVFFCTLKVPNLKAEVQTAHKKSGSAGSHPCTRFEMFVQKSNFTLANVCVVAGTALKASRAR